MEKNLFNKQIYDIKTGWFRKLTVAFYFPLILLSNIVLYMIIGIIFTWKYTIKYLWQGTKPIHKDIIKRNNNMMNKYK